jgi:hypothetical protein
MLRDETIFVVGAGASHELGLPIGIQLAQTISQKLDIRFDRWERTATGDQDLFESIKRHANGDANQFQQSGWLIRDGIILANSIDDFLDAHRHDERVIQMGKVAIAKSIIEAERSSKLHYTTRNVRDTIDFVGCADTWLVKLMRVLVRGVPHKDRSKIFDKCAFIVFNYDRCIEHFFVHALSRFYNIDREEAGDITSKAQIFHPYGTPGPIAVGPQSIHFGASHADWFQLGRAIKTYTESVDAAEIKEAMRAAKQIVFLGFAYHDQNMGLLADPESLRIKTIFGTAYERSASDVTAIAEQITEWIDPIHRSATAKNIHIAPMLTASQIFDYFSKSL